MGHNVLPIRHVAMRDGLMMTGDHHLPPGRQQWRCTASAFAITDYHKNPMLWIEGNQVVGEMSLTVAKPQYAGRADPGITPNSNQTLLWFEVVCLGGIPMIRTWWALGWNIERTQRVARLEILDVNTWPERMKQLLQLMGWVS